jgi:hypothetical protein
VGGQNVATLDSTQRWQRGRRLMALHMMPFNSSLASRQRFFARVRSLFNAALVTALIASPEGGESGRAVIDAELVLYAVHNVGAADDEGQVGHAKGERRGPTGCGLDGRLRGGIR